PARCSWAMTRRAPATASTRIMAREVTGRARPRRRAGAARVLRTTKALRVELPEGPLRLWTVSLGPALCLRDLLAGSSEHCAPAACQHFTQNSQFCKPGSTQAASDAPFW